MLLSPHDVMDPIWGDYGDGRRDDQGLSPRKMWISQTNHGKNDKKTWLHFNLKTVWMITKLFVCVSSKKKKRKRKKHSSFQQQEKKQRKEGTWKEGRTMISKYTRVPFVIVLKKTFECRWNHKQCDSNSTSITHQLRQTNAQKSFCGNKNNGWVKTSNVSLRDKQERLKKDLIKRKKHIVWIPDVWFHWRDRIAVIYITLPPFHLSLSFPGKKTPLNSWDVIKHHCL